MTSVGERPAVALLRRCAQRLAAELLLHNDLDELRREIARLDNRCEFLASVRGPGSRAYRDAATERDMLLLQGDRIISQWVDRYVSTATTQA